MGIPRLMQFIPCNIHVAHNASKKVWLHMDLRLKNLPLISFITSGIFHVDEMVQEKVGFSEQLFIRHIQCRWLTIIPAVTRVAQNWDALVQYFLTQLQRQKRGNRCRMKST